MLLNTLKGFAASPSGWQSVGLMPMNVRASWRPATPFPQPSPLSVATLTQPLAIEVEIYLLIAWILLDLCLES